MRRSIALTTLALAALAAPATAQTFGFGAHAGVSLPVGDYGDVAGTGFLGGLDLWYPLTAAAPALTWYTSVDAIAHDAEGEATDGGFLFVPAMTGIRIDGALGPVSAFVTGQLGLVLSKGPSLDLDAADGIDADWGTDFGFNVGAGLQLTEYIYAGVAYYPLGGMDFEYEDSTVEQDVSFVDIYVGFGVH
ncbi:MAG: hypothetical protein ACLFRX_05680 [Gemmatimonadota bacterium]